MFIQYYHITYCCMRRVSGRMCSAETGAVTRGSSARCSKQPSSQAASTKHPAKAVCIISTR